MRRSVAVVLSIGVVGPALAQAPAYSFEGGRALVATTGAVNRSLGWTFSVSNDIFVTSLGYFDGGNTSPGGPADGLFLSHDVAIWDDAGQVVASATVGAGQSGFTVNNWRYADLGFDVLLEEGRTYTIGSFAPTGTFGTAQPYDPLPSFNSDWIFSLNPADVRPPSIDLSPVVNFEDSVFTLNLPFLTQPSTVGNGNFGLAGGNFLWVPVPGPSAFVGLAIGATLAARRRR